MRYGNCICKKCGLVIWAQAWDKTPTIYSVCTKCEDKMIKRKTIYMERFKFWLHKSNNHILFGIKMDDATWPDAKIEIRIKGIVVNARNDHVEMIGYTFGDCIPDDYVEIPSYEFPVQKRKAQALLWDNDLKRYVTSYAKFSEMSEVNERLDKPESSHLTCIQWPLVANDKEMWGDASENET